EPAHQLDREGPGGQSRCAPGAAREPGADPERDRGDAALRALVDADRPLRRARRRDPRPDRARGQRDAVPRRLRESRRAGVRRSRPLRHPPHDRTSTHVRVRRALLSRCVPGAARGSRGARGGAEAVPRVGARPGELRARTRARRSRLRVAPGLHPLDEMTSSNPFSLADKVALITGGGRGIGAGIARAFVDAGAAVALVSRTKEQVEGVAADINGSRGRAIALPADVTDLDALPGLIEQTVGEFGGLDIVVNCAGGGDMWRAFLDNTVDELETAFHFNVAAPFELVRLAVPHLLQRPGASVVNIVSGAINLQARGHLSYDAAKGALFYVT